MNGRSTVQRLIWADLIWFVRNGKKELCWFGWYVCDGTIFSEELDKRTSLLAVHGHMNIRQKARKWLSDLGYCPRGISDETISNWFIKHDGKSVESFKEFVCEKKAEHADRKEMQKQREAEWKELFGKFGGIVLGIDKKLDVYRSGFSVRVLLRSDLTLNEKRAFLKEHRTDIVKWAMGEIAETKDFKNRIGSLSFYRPSEIVILKIPELEIKFEVKNTAVFDEERKVCRVAN